MNPYATVQLLKSHSVLDIRGTEHDARLRATAENVSRQIDGYCRRRFFTLSATRYFDGDGAGSLWVSDLIAVDPAGLSTDDNLDRRHETTWATSDYFLYPANADPTGGHDDSGPYTRVVVDTVAGARSRFPVGLRTVRISGQWGYWRRLRPGGSLLIAVADNEDYLYVSDQADIEAGHTLLVGAEQMYVLEEDGGAVTVRRGVNGTRASAHDAVRAPVSVYEYPGPVTEAVIVQVARLWRRRAASSPETTVSATVDLDPDVRQLLGPYRRPIV